MGEPQINPLVERGSGNSRIFQEGKARLTLFYKFTKHARLSLNFTRHVLTFGHPLSEANYGRICIRWRRFAVTPQSAVTQHSAVVSCLKSRNLLLFQLCLYCSPPALNGHISATTQIKLSMTFKLKLNPKINVSSIFE